MEDSCGNPDCPKHCEADLRTAVASCSEQRKLLQTVLDAIPGFVALQNHASVYLAANRAFCELVGRTEVEIVGRDDGALFSRRQAALNRREDERILRTKTPLVKELAVARDGDHRWFHLEKLPVWDSEGQVVGLLCSGRDITDFKRVQEQVMMAQKLEAVGQFTAGIAHEINTPLGIILGHAQLLLEDVATGQVDLAQLRDDLQMIEKHTQVCRNIVSDLLRFSRDTENALEPLSINEVIADVRAVVDHIYNLDQVAVRLDLDETVPEIRGDAEKIKQALMNLLNNAFDAIGADGTITVRTGYEPIDRMVTVAVADTGPGIRPEDLDRVFNPFFTTKPVGKGTGLGLSVTRGIIEDQGGRIEVASPQPGPGAVFTIYLPAAEAGAEQREQVDGEDSGT